MLALATVTSVAVAHFSYFAGRGELGSLPLTAPLGCTLVVTETGERIADRPSSSYRNILRYGFEEQYLRPNWIAPA